MLYNSDGLPVIFMVYQKVYIFKCDCWYILPVYTPYFQNKNVNSKNMQYENNILLGKKSLFSKRYTWKKGVAL